MTDEPETILIKRYASRRLYNTELSDYITLDEVADYIRKGKNVKIVDRKSGDDLTRQYLLQIITEYETRGENVLPINVLMDIVRSYNNQAQSFIPDFLSQSFDMLKQQQSEAIKAFQKNVSGAMPSIPTLPTMQGLEEWQKMQSGFLNQMMGAWVQQRQEDEPEHSTESEPAAKSKKQTSSKKAKTSPDKAEELDAIKKQLSDLQSKLKDL